ncbi:MAG: LptF/LptG family permease [Candidatus Omnitrophica bacterium]|nr:LptF/LptG family permease [Candidatus Omnitrophota bacterium]
MTIVDRYTFKSFISIFLFSLLFLWVLYVIGDIFGFLDEILKERIPVTSLAAFYYYLTPFILIQIIPICTLIASVYLLGNLNRHNEITALRASGISVWVILRPILTAAFIISVIVFILNDRFLPTAMRKANRIRYEKLDVAKRGRSGTISVKNVAIYGAGNRIIFARKFDIQNSSLEDIIIHQHDVKQDLILKISAKRIYWTKNRWRGEDVVIYRMNNSGQFIGEPVISQEMDIPIVETPTDFINNQWKPEFMSYRRLKSYIEVFATGSKKTYQRLLVDLDNKIAFPFTCIVTILISAPFTLSTARGGALLGMAKGMLIALLYIPVMAIGLALGKGGILPPLLGAWFSNIIFASAGIYLLNKY